MHFNNFLSPIPFCRNFKMIGIISTCRAHSHCFVNFKRSKPVYNTCISSLLRENLTEQKTVI